MTSGRARLGWIVGLAFLAGAPVAAAIRDGYQSMDSEAEEREAMWLRYELGRRLREVERAYASADPAARERALPALKSAVMHFFAGDTQGSARALGAARRAAEGAEPALERSRAWADALAVRPAQRCLELDVGALALELAAFHEPDGAPRPRGELRFRAELAGANGRRLGSLDAPIGGLPATFRLELNELEEGDGVLRTAIALDGVALRASEQVVSAVHGARKRVDAAFGAATREVDGLELESCSLRGLCSRLDPLLAGGCDETDLPVARLVAEAEELAAALRAGTKWLDGARAGDHWLRLPLGTGVMNVRLQIPSGLVGGEARPLLLALHGAGGSENLFFDGHGNGLAARLASERGWFLAAPRASAWKAPDLPGMVDALAERLPIDRSRVALIGHSLGAAHAVQQLSDAPELFAAAALISGGGAARASQELAAIRFWVGAGAEDFGLPAARELARALRAAGAESVELREYPSVEHLAAVQVALPDVFAFLDRAVGAR